MFSPFVGYEHYNFCGIDEKLGPVVISVKNQKVKNQHNNSNSAGKA